MNKPCFKGFCQFLSVMILAICLGFTGVGYAKTVTLLYSGETHAALEHCSCPIAPNGGLRRRATVIKNTRKKAPGGEILLLDTGGIFAGGIYDENITGPGPDRRRTEFTLKAVRRFNYNAVAIADEELAYGKAFLLKYKDLFISANLQDVQTGKLLFQPYRIVKIQGVRFGLIALSPQALKGDPAGIKIGDPMSAARDVVKNVRSKVDVVIALSPLGESNSMKLLREIPGIDILLNGDESASNQFYHKVDGRHFFQFFFQGRFLGHVEMEFDEKNRLVNVKPGQIALSDKIPDDPEMNALLNKHYARDKAAGDARIQLDLYVTSYCPEGRKAENALIPLITSGNLASRIDWNINFIGDILPDGSIGSLHGPLEVAEGIRQLLIAKYLPDTFWNYLACTNSAIPGAPWQECLGSGVKLIESKIASKEGEQLFRDNIRQVQSMRINVSPVIFINNSRFRGSMHTLAFLKDFCGQLDPQGNKISDCKQLPECIEDTDCDRAGMVGTCLNKGSKRAKCTAGKDAGVKLTVLYDPKTMMGAINHVTNLLKKVSPGMQEERIDYQTIQGKNLINRYGIDRLPAYLYNQNLPKIKRFTKIEEMVIRKGDRYLLNPRNVGGNRYIHRKPIPRRIDIFSAPLDLQGTMAVRKIMDVLKNRSVSSTVQIFFHHMVLGTSEERKKRPLGMAGEEEALRRIAIEIYHPKLLNQYLAAWEKRMGSGYWEEPLADVWLVHQQIKAESRQEEVIKRLEEDKRLLEGIEVNQPIIFLINNQEIVDIRNIDTFEKLYRNLANTPQ